MSAIFQPVTMQQLQSHIRIYGVQALSVLAVLVAGYVFDLGGRLLLSLGVGVVILVFLAGMNISRLSPIQQGTIAKSAMLFTFPPIFNALFLIAIIAAYVFSRPLGILLWLGLIAFEGAGFIRACKDWDSYLAKVNAHAG